MIYLGNFDKNITVAKLINIVIFPLIYVPEDLVLLYGDLSMNSYSVDSDEMIAITFLQKFLLNASLSLLFKVTLPTSDLNESVWERVPGIYCTYVCSGGARIWDRPAMIKERGESRG